MADFSFSKDSLFLFVAQCVHFFHTRPELLHLIELYFQTQRDPNPVFEALKSELSIYVSTEMHRADPLRTLPFSADPTRIYIDGCFDIMHSGHFNAIRQAKMLGGTLVVGIHSDEEIGRNKGMPIMNDSERIAMVRACKWADEIVLDAPYSPTIEWLDRHNCMYIAHGDDIAINSEGKDAYGELKACGRFKVIKRTEGISTTSLVGKLLLMTNDHPETVETPMMASEFKEAQRHFLTTSRRISEFSNGLKPTPEARIIYIDGAFDLFHVGHVETLKKAKSLGDFLIVGVHDDLTVNAHKGANYPIMNLHERVLCVLSCKYVDEVVIGAPWVVTQDLLTSLNVSLVVQGTITKLDLTMTRKRSMEYTDAEDPYRVPKSLQLYLEVQSESQLQTSDIIQRIIDNRLKHLNRFERTSAKEENYYTRIKHFVTEV